MKVASGSQGFSVRLYSCAAEVRSCVAFGAQGTWISNLPKYLNAPTLPSFHPRWPSTFAGVPGGGHFLVTAGALNARQTEAVKQGLQRRFSVVQGPPGTGRARKLGISPCCFTSCFLLSHLWFTRFFSTLTPRHLFSYVFCLADLTR